LNVVSEGLGIYGNMPAFFFFLGPGSVSRKSSHSNHYSNSGCFRWRWSRPHVPPVCSGQQHTGLYPHHIPRGYSWTHWPGKNSQKTSEVFKWASNLLDLKNLTKMVFSFI